MLVFGSSEQIAATISGHPARYWMIAWAKAYISDT